MLNLTDPKTITVNDGVDDIKYSVIGNIYQLIKGATATAGGKTAVTTLGANSISFKFPDLYDANFLASTKVDFELNDEAELVGTVTSGSVSLDLNRKTQTIKVKDKVSGVERSLEVVARTADVINLEPGSWTDYTSEFAARTGAVVPSSVTVYKTDKLNGQNGRVGYTIAIPAGSVQAKLVAKGELSDPNKNSIVSKVLHDNPDWGVFVPFQCPGVWQWDSGSPEKKYISPIVYKDGKSYRTPGFDGNASRKMCPPVISVIDSKAQIRFAELIDGKIYSFDRFTRTPSAETGSVWDVPFAVSGYFMILYNGENLIGGENTQSYEVYKSEYLMSPDMRCQLTPSWKNDPINNYMALHAGRVALGVTKKGDLVILQVAMLMNSHNQGQKEHKNKEDVFGSTMFETAEELKRMGCETAMLIDDNYWSCILMQDGGKFNDGPLYGVDFFQHQIRYNLDNDKRQSELANLAVLMLK